MKQRRFQIGSALLLAALVTGCSRGVPSEVEVRVRRVALDPASRSPVILLEDPANDVALPIWIGPIEAQAIAAHLAGAVPQRPLTHDLMKAMLERLGAVMQRVVIRELRDDTYYAEIVLDRAGEEMSLDSRPSDAIALAVRFNQPIFVNRELFNREAIVDLRADAGEDALTVAGVTVQGLTSELARHFALPAGSGVLVSDVADSASAALERGDVILEVDGEPVRGPVDFRAKVRRGSGLATLRVQRDDHTLDVPLDRALAAR